jgi:D-sedoheptulose 7-phosphate isomerase
MSKDWIGEYLNESAKVKRDTADRCWQEIVGAADLISEAFSNGNKLLLCGNGGSAADCQHFAGEFVSLLSCDFERPALPAIALTTDTSFLTAYANDFAFEGVFLRQVEALGNVGDVLLGISTSGNSANIVKAIEYAKDKGLKTISLTGNQGLLMTLADVSIAVPHQNTQHIQEAHIAIEHVICSLVERSMFT